MCAALRRPEAVLVGPPAALGRAPGWRDRRRAARARRGGAEIGSGTVLGRAVVFDLAPGARASMGDGAALGDGCRLHLGRGASVSIGRHTRLGDHCTITAHERVTIGSGCLLADEVVLVDGDPRFDDVERPVREQGLATSAVTVGDGVRIGPGVAILRGVTIGAGASIGAHAVVTRDVAPGASVEGVPAGPGGRGARPPRARRA
jgi:acetyltransferase-like isoleucine patch superfamily enzyme